MGGALGALETLFLPGQGAGFWPLISMGAMLAGTMRSPLTGVIFAFELTSDYHSILPLLIACVAAHTLTVLTLPRSILTEKISRRGHHLTREYVIDPMEILAVDDVMSTNITALPAATTVAELENVFNNNESGRGQRIYPVIDGDRLLVGLVTRSALQKMRSNPKAHAKSARLQDIFTGDEPVIAYPDEPLRFVVNRMASTGLTRLPVVSRGAKPELLGLISLQDLLKAREFNLDEEHKRERVLRLRLPASLRRRDAQGEQRKSGS
jgi:chloride channel protein, CIC family